jgi:hypothetical protein
VSVGCLLSELSGTDEVTLVGTESHSESCTTHGVCKAIVEVAKDGYSANPSPIAAKLPERCGDGKGYLIESQAISVRPSGLRTRRAEV